MASQRTFIDVNWNWEAINFENEAKFGDIQGKDDEKVYKQGKMELIRHISFDSSKEGRF